MKNFIFAIKMCLKIARDHAFAENVHRLLRGELAPPQLEEETPPEPPLRNDAVTLLAALQREGRFVDFVQEDLDPYDDAQIGAVVRDVHKGTKKAITRMFDIQHVLEQEDGAEIEIGKSEELETITLVGNVSGELPYQGTVQHPGWKISKCELPQWSGSEKTASIIVPAEVEV